MRFPEILNGIFEETKEFFKVRKIILKNLNGFLCVVFLLYRGLREGWENRVNHQGGQGNKKSIFHFLFTLIII
jgi:hypothetical protein